MIGKRIRISKPEANQIKILEFWSECQSNGDFATLISLDTAQTKGMFGIFSYDTYPDEMLYSIMVISDKPLPQGYSEMILPNVTWAIFDCHGRIPEAITNGWKFLQEEWLVKYPFQHAPCPELEWYSNGNQYSDTYKSQIWIPIIEEK